MSRINNGKRVENENDESSISFAHCGESEVKIQVFVLLQGKLLKKIALGK